MCAMNTTPDILEELVRIPVADSTIVGQLSYRSEDRPIAAALIAGAHPLLGGNMQNNVTTILRQRLAARGVLTMTFEYRNDPQLRGAEEWAALVTEFWRSNHVPVEKDWRFDCKIAFEYLRDMISVPTILAGYSFGCWSIAELANSPGVEACVCISPNPDEHELVGFCNVKSPLLVIGSDNDFSCPYQHLLNWYDGLQGVKQFECLPAAEHFFRGREDQVASLVTGFLESRGLIEH